MRPAGAAAVEASPLLRHGVITRGVAYNLGGVAVPALLGLLTMPYLVRGLGLERLGVLVLAWTVLGYLSAMHLGVGRALTQAVGSSRGQAVGTLLATAVSIAAAAGVLGSAVVLLAAAPLARALELAPGLERETVLTLRIVAVAVPFAVGAPVLAGLLEARGRFGSLNAVTGSVSAATYLGPVIALALGAGLPGIACVLVAARGMGWLVLGTLCMREVPTPLVRTRPSAERARALLRFGSWTTVSQLTAPLMTYADRFVIAGALSATAVAYYATPQEVALRIGMISGAVFGVLFPAFAAATAAADAPVRLASLLKGGWQAAFALSFLPTLMVAAFAGEGLDLWLGGDWSAVARWPLVWISAGLLVNAVAKVPAALLLGSGRPDVAAKIHLVELAIYLPLLVLLVQRYGIVGAAAAWALRTAVDAAAMLAAASRVVPGTGPIARRAATAAAAGGVAVAAGAFIEPVPLRIAWVLVLGGTIALAGALRLAALRPAHASASGNPSGDAR